MSIFKVLTSHLYLVSVKNSLTMAPREFCRDFSNMILLLIALPCTIVAFAVYLENKSQMICIPNATFHIDCNRCKCSPSGMSMDCTDWSCATLTIPYDILVNLTMDCQPGQVLFYNKYKCLCSESGSHAACSSAQLELSRGLRPRHGVVRTSSEAPDACTPGALFKHGCDTCICDETGSDASCLGIRHCYHPMKPCEFGLCVSSANYPANSTQKLCVPYSTFSADCNRCACRADGLSYYCDSFPCLGVEMRNDQILNLTFPCLADGTFLYNERECRCSDSGGYALCTVPRDNKVAEYRAAGRRVFEVAEFSDLCTPGSVFKQMCNLCICSSKQRAACTRTDCRLVERGEEPVDAVLVTMDEIWTKQTTSKKFCRNNYASMYCRHLRGW